MHTLSEQQIREFLRTKPDRRNQIGQVFEDFTNSIIPELKEIKNNGCKKKNNVYQLCDATKLSAANDITRKYNTKLGLLWEKIASLSPNVLSPELDFGASYKIPEVDVIVLYKKSLYYVQLKTQKNTLTGSQSSRTVEGLTTYKNHWFVACIENDCSSTIPKVLNKLIGRQFWDKIGIDYDTEILPNLKNSVMKLENLL